MLITLKKPLDGHLFKAIYHPPNLKYFNRNFITISFMNSQKKYKKQMDEVNFDKLPN